MEIIYNLSEINQVSKKIISLSNDYKIITFSGELGSGKTTLINAICNELGVVEFVSSPTYSIIQEYGLGANKVIYHMDLYRIKNSQEAFDAGVEDCLLSGELCLVEWPGNAEAIFPRQTVNIFISPVSDNQRKLVVELPQ